jgi:hypothetical protein
MGLDLMFTATLDFLSEKQSKHLGGVACAHPTKARDSPTNTRDQFPLLPVSSLTVTRCHNFVTVQLASSSRVPCIVGQIPDLKVAFV